MTNLPTNAIEWCIEFYCKYNPSTTIFNPTTGQTATAQLDALKAHISNIEYELKIVKEWNEQSDDPDATVNELKGALADYKRGNPEQWKGYPL